MLNKVILMGRLVADPELKRTPNDVAVCSFRLAVDRPMRSGGEKQTDFIDIVSWRNNAEFVSRWMHKGTMAIVCGSLQSRKWTDRNGQNRVSWEVVADEVRFGESKKDAQSRPSFGDSFSQPFDLPDDGSQFSEIEDDDDKLPF